MREASVSRVIWCNTPHTAYMVQHICIWPDWVGRWARIFIIQKKERNAKSPMGPVFSVHSATRIQKRPNNLPCIEKRCDFSFFSALSLHHISNCFVSLCRCVCVCIAMCDSTAQNENNESNYSIHEITKMQMISIRCLGRDTETNSCKRSYGRDLFSETQHYTAVDDWQKFINAHTHTHTHEIKENKKHFSSSNNHNCHYKPTHTHTYNTLPLRQIHSFCRTVTNNENMQINYISDLHKQNMFIPIFSSHLRNGRCSPSAVNWMWCTRHNGKANFLLRQNAICLVTVNEMQKMRGQTNSLL